MLGYDASNCAAFIQWLEGSENSIADLRTGTKKAMGEQPVAGHTRASMRNTVRCSAAVGPVLFYPLGLHRYI